VYTRAASLTEIFSVVSELLHVYADNLSFSWLLPQLAADRRSVLLPSVQRRLTSTPSATWLSLGRWSHYHLLPVYQRMARC